MEQITFNPIPEVNQVWERKRGPAKDNIWVAVQIDAVSPIYDGGGKVLNYDVSYHPQGEARGRQVTASYNDTFKHRKNFRLTSSRPSELISMALSTFEVSLVEIVREGRLSPDRQAFLLATASGLVKLM